MQTEEFRSLPDIPLRALQRSRDEHLLELASCVVVADPLVEEILNELFELFPHGY